MSRREFLVKGTAVAGAAGAAIAVPGCKTLPQIDSVRTMFYAGGATTSLVINETKLDADQRQVLKEIVTEIRKCTPEVGQPLSVKLVAVAQLYVDQLVQEGRIQPDASVLIMAAIRTVGVGLDLLENRYPIVRTSVDYAAAAIDGFSNGFLDYLSVECEECQENCTLKAARLGYDITIVRAVNQAAVKNNLK